MKLLKFTLIPALFLAFFAVSPLRAESGIEENPFSQAELDQMLAPIALYPDVLLSQVLMAATYPLEVVEASRWSKANSDLEGDQAVLAVEDEDWDTSVKYLVGFPDLIQLMDENLVWTRRLGDAFLVQEEQVMDTIQNLRQRSLDEGSLDDLAHITVEQQEDVIIIEPAEVEVVYVPYYSTRVVYGNWWWNDYPPYYWDSPFSYYVGSSFFWSRGFRVSTGFYFSWCDWNRHRIVLSHHRHGHHRYDWHSYRHRSRHDAQDWRHNPHHRRGIHYRSHDLNSRYDRHSASGRTSQPLPSRDHVRRSDSDRRTNSHAARPDRNIRTDRVDRTDRSDRISRPDRTERTNRVERTDTPNRRVDANRVTRQSPPNRHRTVTTAPPRTVKPKPSAQTSRPTVATKPARQAPTRQAPPPKRTTTTNSSSNTSNRAVSSSNPSSSRNSGHIANSRQSRSSNASGSRGKYPRSDP